MRNIKEKRPSTTGTGLFVHLNSQNQGKIEMTRTLQGKRRKDEKS